MLEDQGDKAYRVLGFSNDIDKHKYTWPPSGEKCRLHPESWPERLLKDSKKGQAPDNTQFIRSWAARDIDGVTLIDAVAIQTRFLHQTIGKDEVKGIEDAIERGVTIDEHDPEMKGCELAVRERGFTNCVAAVLGCIAEKHASGVSPREAARALADTWWAGPEETQPNKQCVSSTLKALKQEWCPGSIISRFYAHTTLNEIDLWLKQSNLLKDPQARAARTLTPRRSATGHGRWAPPPLYGDEALPLPRGVAKLSPQAERLNCYAARGPDGKFQPVTVGTDGGFKAATREGAAASTPLSGHPNVRHTPYDCAVETASPLPFPCDSSTESERVAHIQVDVTSPQELLLKVKSGSKGAIALHKQSVANVKNPRGVTVRRKTTRKFHALQTAAESQLQHRLDAGHPLPQITWIKGHVLDNPNHEVSEQEMKAHTLNSRSGGLCEYALSKPTPEVHKLLGQPLHYLYSTTGGKALTHGPQHHIKSAESKMLLTRMRRHRRQGQLMMMVSG